MNCEECQNILLDSFLEEDRREERSLAAQQHLDGCEACRAWWREIQAVSECLETTDPGEIQAPAIESVWMRIESKRAAAARKTTAPWWLDVMEVAAAGTVVLAIVIGLHSVLATWLGGVVAFSPVLNSLIANPLSFAVLVAVFGMLAGACSAPLLIRKRTSLLWRHP